MLRSVLLVSVFLSAWTLSTASESNGYSSLEQDGPLKYRKSTAITATTKPSLMGDMNMNWNQRHHQLDRRKCGNSYTETRIPQSILIRRSPGRRSGKASKSQQDSHTSQGRHPSLSSSTLSQPVPRPPLASRSRSPETTPRDQGNPSTPSRKQHSGPPTESEIPKASTKGDRHISGSDNPPAPRRSPNMDSTASDSSARLETPRMSRPSTSQPPPTSKEEGSGRRQAPPIRRFMSSRMSTDTESDAPEKIEDKANSVKSTSAVTQSTLELPPESSEQAGPSFPPPLHADSVIGIPSSLSPVKITGDTTGGIYRKLRNEAMAPDEYSGVTFSSGREPDKPPRGPRPPGLPKGPSAPGIPKRPPGT